MNILRPLSCLALAAALCQCTLEPKPAAQAVQPGMPADFCYVDEVAPLVRVDLKYAGSDNFVGRPIDGYTGRRAVLRKDTAAALRTASEILAKQGYGLLVWDAYRPARALKDFRAWSRTPDDSTRATFYPRITKQEIYDNRYIGDVSEHSWGIALDLTLFRLSDGKEVDMGGRHDLLDVSSATRSPLVPATARANRLILHDAMLQAGFCNYSKEWWHYFLRNRGDCYNYNFPLDDNAKR